MQQTFLLYKYSAYVLISIAFKKLSQKVLFSLLVTIFHWSMRLPMLIPTKSIGWGLSWQQEVCSVGWTVGEGWLSSPLAIHAASGSELQCWKLSGIHSLLNCWFVVLLTTPKVGLCLRGVTLIFLLNLHYIVLLLSEFLVIAYANVRNLALNISQFHGYD